MGLHFSRVMFPQSQVFPVSIFTPQINYPLNFCYNFISLLMAIFHQVFVAPREYFGCGRDENKVACSLHQPPRVYESNSCLSKVTHLRILKLWVACE